MDCSEIKERILDEYIEKGFLVTEGLRKHLEHCQSCRLYSRSIELIKDDFQRDVFIPDLEAKKERLYRNITAEKFSYSLRYVMAAAVLIFVLFTGIFYLYVNPDAKSDADSSIIYALNGEIDSIIEHPGDLYYNMDLDKMSDKDFALLLSSLDFDINYKGD